MGTPRLYAIVDMVPKSGVVADIGCDHGKTAVLLLKNGKAKRVICTDISAKSLEKARALLSSKELDGLASFRSGDGLTVLEKGEADTVVISGLGGDLMAKILEKGKEKAPAMLVLSCNTKPETVRSWLCDNGYRVEDEDIVSDGSYFYTVMLARKGEPQKLNDIELELGPVLLNKKPPAFVRFVRKKIDKMEEKRTKILVSGTPDSGRLLRETDIKLGKYREVIE
jgi:tRNA (adenine22-N1)-methyltransferase